jgi:hypothetical protein
MSVPNHSPHQKSTNPPVKNRVAHQEYIQAKSRVAHQEYVQAKGRVAHQEYLQAKSRVAHQECVQAKSRVEPRAKPPQFPAKKRVVLQAQKCRVLLQKGAQKHLQQGTPPNQRLTAISPGR